jgi:large subunit ribosomal protein L13
VIGERNKTRLASAAEAARKEWYVVDADGQILGRLATQVATVLMGKHKPTYTPYLDTGDFVIVVNADKIRLTGKKPQTKTYQRYSGYFGGQRFIPYETMKRKSPAKVVELAVRRMLPKTTLGLRMIRKLKVYAGPDHPHGAQQPKPFPLKVGRRHA